MKFSHQLQANLHHLTHLAKPEMTDDVDNQSNEDYFGVGAMMPQDMPEYMFLAETESYGV